jgi:hypothetical protein
MITAFLIKILLFVTPISVERTDITPGCLCTENDPDFDGFRYKEQIAHCQRHVTNRTLKLVRKSYRIDPKDDSKFEYDHLIPLSLGGSNSACNIWPEPLADAHQKDILEFKMYQLLKNGKITQKDAISQLLAWPRKVNN